jgi:hypothetical protein
MMDANLIDGLERLGASRGMIEASIARRSLSPELRFTLEDPEKRIFSAERGCYRGSIDGWIRTHHAGSIADLVESLVPHLGRESFYELM